MTLARIVLALMVAIALHAAPAAPQEPARLALIIDQTNYTSGLSRVELARSEADHIDKALKATGFTVTRKSDLTRAALEDELGAFRATVEAAGPDTIVFVYYTGHGSQHPQSGDSYLLGTDARLKSASDLAVYGLDLASQRDGFSATGAKAVFLVFDACRNVPALPGFKANVKGIGRVEAEPDMLIAYSTRLNDVAEEGVYAPILAEELMRPGQTAETAFTAAQRRVQQSTARKQRPYTDMDLSNEVCFAGCTLPVAATKPAPSTASPAPGKLRKGDTFRDKLKDGTEGPEMVVIPAGEFSMGSSILEQGRSLDEGMVRTVRIPRDFAVSKLEVTESDYEKCRKAGKCPSPKAIWYRAPSSSADDSIYPSIMSWTTATAYAAFLSEQTGARYRLLSEAEWEYAARAGTEGRFSNGGDEKDLCRIANLAADQDVGVGATNTLCNDGNRGASTVGQFRVNAFGLADMHGNVWEWTADCYQGSYSGAPTDGSARTACDTKDRVLRGGSYKSAPSNARSAARNKAPPDSDFNDTGLRLARELD